MMVSIENIVIKERIRKDVTKISELAEDIKKNGLINPVTVMVLGSGEYQLLAGLRRIKAMQFIGLTEIEVNIVTPAGAEAALHIEVSENEQREQFTFSEKMDYGRMFERLERANADERKADGQSKGGITAGRGRPKDNSMTDRGPSCYQSQDNVKKETRDVVGAKIGMSGRQYDRAKYIYEKAPKEVIEELDSGGRNIRCTYDELKAKEKAIVPPAADDSAESEDFNDEAEDACLPETEAETESTPSPKTETSPKAAPKPKREPSAVKRVSEVPEEELLKLFSKKDIAAMRKLDEFNAMSPEEKVVELQRQLFDMRVKANAAQSELDRLKYEYGIKVDHKDSIIDSLKRQNAELREALEEAEKRIAELEELEPCDDLQQGLGKGGNPL